MLETANTEAKSTHVGRTTDRDDYETPNEFFCQVQTVFDFNVDLAADRDNSKCPDFYSADRSFEESCTTDLIDKKCWLNPPFSQKEMFLRRVVEVRHVTDYIVCLVPNNSRETDWWRDYVVHQADEIINLTPRVNYLLDGKPLRNGVPFASCLVVYYPRFVGANYGLPREIYWNWKN